MHIRSGTQLPIADWIELLDEKLRDMDEHAHCTIAARLKEGMQASLILALLFQFSDNSASLA